MRNAPQAFLCHSPEQPRRGQNNGTEAAVAFTPENKQQCRGNGRVQQYCVSRALAWPVRIRSVPLLGCELERSLVGIDTTYFVCRLIGGVRNVGRCFPHSFCALEFQSNHANLHMIALR